MRILLLYFVFFFSSLGFAQSTIQEAEYFWGTTDPGAGSGTVLMVYDGAFDEAIEAVMGSGTLPSSGINLFNIRVKDGSGNWGRLYKRTVYQYDNSIYRDANLVQAEYFWGTTDPGAGSGTVMLVFDGAFDEAIEAVMGTGTLPSSGINLFNIRVKDGSGNWGRLYKRTVYQYDNSIYRDANLVQAEYFWGTTDPGVGNGIAMLAEDGSFNESVETIVDQYNSAFSTDTNLLNIRVKDGLGNWGRLYKRTLVFHSTIDSVQIVNSINDTICLGDSTTLNAISASASHFVWSSGDTLNNLTVSPTSTTTYYVEATHVNGQVDTSFFTVFVESATQNSILSSQDTICNNSLVTLSLNNATAISWSTGSSAFSISINPINDTIVYADFSSINGCVYSDTVSIVVNNTSYGSEMITACDSYTWIDGSTYTNSISGVTHTLTNSLGCDSIVTLDLTINNSNYNTVDQIVACNSYTWIDGITYYVNNNTATYTLQNIYGCDSVIDLVLDIYQPQSVVDVQSACNSYTWSDGVTYTSSNNTATQLLSNVGGCDSLVNLNLTIHSSDSVTDLIYGCGSYTWIDGVTYTTNNNTATYTLPNIYGCDSIVNLDLTITNNSYGSELITACDSYTWIDGVTYTTSNNTATYTLPNIYGCDSIVTLDLTINNSSSNAISYCGANADLSCVSSNQVTIGSSSSYNSSTGWPAPFGNYYKNARQQFLYKASELNAMGIYGGKITNIAWQTLYSNSSTSTFYDYTIKMGCTQSNSLSSSWETGLFTVYQPKTFVVIFGWNQLDFDTAYEWDGVSNLVIEICYDNLNYNYTNNWSTPYENTPFNSSNSYYSDIAYACSSTNASSLSSNRPITKFNICSSSFYPPVFACDQYTWVNGQTYYNSNSSATYTLINSAGCDSVVGLNLTVGQSDFVVDHQDACNSYTWIDGNTYTTNNNTATHVLTNSTGCDSIVQLDLTIYNVNNTVDQFTACDSYTWINGVTYTSSNNSAVYTTTNLAGCDSIVSLDLTINYSSTSNDVITACGSYTWINGVTYTSNGSAIYTVPNSVGCDSTVFLDLTINQVQTGIINNSPTLSAVASNASYQWLNCLDGFSVIQGETNQSFTVTNNGSFAVEVTQNNCIDTSICESINNLNIFENTFEFMPALYPNPSMGIVHVDFRKNVKNLSIEIYDIQGKKINEFTYDEAILIKIDVSNYERGVYEIRLVANDPKAYAKLKLVKM